MKATELRIGNYHNYNTGEGVELAVTDWQDLKHLTEHPDDHNYLPVPLTEEWLIKLGFKYYKYWNYWQIKGNSRLKVYPSNTGFWYRERFHFEIEYVHQLQNIYHALTGEELIIKNK